ncbi:MAG TPA: tetratricopeptide repeat protein [Burkholderiales bacterium]|nr:tetratricopeptide repeat protein [Burkholderiales bacterium]
MFSRLREWVGRGASGQEAGRSALERGAAALRARDAEAARAHFARAAQAAPDDGPLHARCGRLLAEAGLVPEALRFLERAHALDPADAPIALALAEVLRASGQAQGARTLAEQVLAREPGHGAAHTSLGLAQLACGAPEAARSAFERALERAPADAAAAHGLALALHAQGRAEEALGVLIRTIQGNPEHVPSLELAGGLALERGDAAGALAWLERAADLEPQNAGLQSNLGLACLRAGRVEEAIESLQLALHHRPEHVPAQVNLGLAHLEGREWGEAERAFAAALARVPDHPQALAGRARALQGLYRLEEAEAGFERALAAAPSAELWTRLGQVHRELGRFAEAKAAFEQALTLEPTYFSALTQLGIVALDLHEPARAIECFERVIASGSGLADEARWNITCARLACGDWARAWEFFDARWASPDSIPRPFRFPAWDGGEVRGKTLLVYAEQGLGDEIMFASCYPELAARGARLVLECAPKLERLFARSFPEAVVIGRNQTDPVDWLERVPRIDVQAACGTVASYLRRSAASFPAHAGYLRADPARVAYWRARLAGLGPGPKIGISWRGGTAQTRLRLRSVTLADWRPVLESPGAAFVSLQYQRDAAAEVATFGRESGLVIHHWQEAIDDYDETAALVCALDGVVSVCTAVIHLAGALGRPVDVVVPCSPEWPFGLEGEAMVWYPSVRLFRQTEIGRWDEVTDAVRRAQTAVG